jgi:hypothetical protein
VRFNIKENKMTLSRIGIQHLLTRPSSAAKITGVAVQGYARLSKVANTLSVNNAEQTSCEFGGERQTPGVSAANRVSVAEQKINPSTPAPTPDETPPPPISDPDKSGDAPPPAKHALAQCKTTMSRVRGHTPWSVVNWRACGSGPVLNIAGRQAMPLFTRDIFCNASSVYPNES